MVKHVKQNVSIQTRCDETNKMVITKMQSNKQKVNIQTNWWNKQNKKNSKQNLNIQTRCDEAHKM